MIAAPEVLRGAGGTEWVGGAGGGGGVGGSGGGGRDGFFPDGATEHPVSTARKSGDVSRIDGRNRYRQARNGRAGTGGWRQVSFRIVGRHDQTRGAGPRARARSRDRVSRRADLGSGSHCGGRIR